MAEERAVKIAQAAFKAQERVEAQGGLPDIHVPGMENSAGGGGQVSASAYISEAMGTSLSKPTLTTKAPQPEPTPVAPVERVTESTRESSAVTIGGSYGKGHQAKVIRRVMESEGRKAEVSSITEGVRPGLDVNGAMQELKTADRSQIEYEAALAWAGRSVAAFTLSIQSPDRAAQVLRFSEGDDYSGEAREHASLVGDNGKLLRFIVEQIEQTRESALANSIKPDHQR